MADLSGVTGSTGPLRLPILCYMIRAEEAQTGLESQVPARKGLIHMWVFST